MIMKFKNLLMTMALVFVFTGLFADKVEKKEAAEIATRFYNEKYQVNHPGSQATFHITESHTIELDGTEVIYVFNFSNDGYAVVPADDRIYPVVGFSFNTTFNPDIAPDNWKYVLNNFGEQVKHVRQNQVEATVEVANAWTNLRSNERENFSFLANNIEIGPLVLATWNQDYPYNYLCPADPQGPGGHVYAGCVATAMSMLMYHWRFPYQGTGSHTYYPAGYGQQTANFGESYYNFEAMTNSVSGAPNYDVALLQYHCGVAVNMMYGPDGSSAYSQDVVGAIKNYFNYANNAQFLQRGGWAAWKAYLDQQMTELQPVYYSGKEVGSPDGHAFVVDGMQEQTDDTYYHFNFGWDGSGNGWFLVTDAGGYTSNNGMIRNFVPNPDMYPYDPPEELVVLDHLVGTLDDCSGPKHFYHPNQNSQWLISPQNETDSVSYIRIIFDRFDTQEGTDVVRIYDGADETAPLIGEYSGTEIPETIYSIGNEVLITFTTDDEVEASGWMLSYKAFQPTWCTGLTSHTAPNGTFDDGSGSFYYNNGTTCMWTIEPQWANTATISFNYFDTELDKDFLKVYDLASQQLLANLSGQDIPEPITSPSGKFYLVFSANNANRGMGWELNYEADNVGIAENDEIFDHLSIYPNPANKQLNISFVSQANENVNVSLVNMTGVTMYENTLVSNNSAYSNAIDVSEFAKGIYILRIHSDKSDVVRKIVIE
jgi:hypothetical protein